MNSRPIQSFMAAKALFIILHVVFLPHLELQAYNLQPEKWLLGNVVMYPQLGSPGGTLLDGNTSWDQVAENAMAEWNPNLYGIQFTVVRNSTATPARRDGRNSMFWSSTVFGSSFGPNTLAVTLKQFSNGRISEADVVFNNAKSWNSYRGSLRNGITDFKRVALHELGHVVGLDHPDDIGQNVTAIMNANVSNLDQLAEDDKAGAAAQYGQSALSFYNAQYYYNLYYPISPYLAMAYYYYHVGYAYYYNFIDADQPGPANYYLNYYLAFYYYNYFLHQKSLSYAAYYYHYYMGYSQYYLYYYQGNTAAANSALSSQFYYANYYFNYYLGK